MKKQRGVKKQPGVKKQRGVFEKMPGSGVWWVRYTDAAGKLRREKAGSKSAAITLYSKRKIQVLEGVKLPENLRSVLHVADLAPALLRDYEVNGRKSLDSVERRLRKHVLPFFGEMPANEVGTDQINSYIAARQKEQAENGTINREMAALKRMYSLARTSTPPKVRAVPVFPRLKENPPRQGFVEDQQYSSLVQHAEELWLKAILAVAYTYGFRKSELLLNLKVGQVSLKDNSIRLYAGTTKNDEGRSVKMTKEVRGLLCGCLAGKAADDYLFTRSDKKRVRNFRGAWYSLCERASLGKFVRGEDKKPHWRGLIFHDLRRSAVRNMVRRGVLETVAMKISGHKTRSVFDRYNIVSEADLHDAALKIEQGREVEKQLTPEGRQNQLTPQLTPGQNLNNRGSGNIPVRPVQSVQ